MGSEPVQQGPTERDARTPRVPADRERGRRSVPRRAPQELRAPSTGARGPGRRRRAPEAAAVGRNDRALPNELRDKRLQAAVPAHETVALAPAWVIALEQGFGLKGKHWLYGATPPRPRSCTTRAQRRPGRAYGRSASLLACAGGGGRAGQHRTGVDRGVCGRLTGGGAPSGAAAINRARGRRMREPVAGPLVGAAQSGPRPSWRPGLASSRTLVAPATNCGRPAARSFVSPTRGPRSRNRTTPLSSRCFCTSRPPWRAMSCASATALPSQRPERRRRHGRRWPRRARPPP